MVGYVAFIRHNPHDFTTFCLELGVCGRLTTVTLLVPQAVRIPGLVPGLPGLCYSRYGLIIEERGELSGDRPSAAHLAGPLANM